MDACPSRIRSSKCVCVTYILTFLLLFFFFHMLLTSNVESALKITNLRDDMTCLMRILQSGDKECMGKNFDGKTTQKFLRNNPSQPNKVYDTRELNSLVDSLIKSKMDPILDDVYNMKRQMEKSQNCPALSKDALSVINNRINYASEELGARITSVKAISIGGSTIFKSLFCLDFCTNEPINMLRANILPGSCFGYQGSEATVNIRLAKSIIVEEIALTHISKEMSPLKCVDNAPKDFEAYVIGILADNNEVLIGRWKYNNSLKTRTQYYKVKCSKPIQNMKFIFKTNYGANTTCIYRTEVFGKLSFN